VLFIIYLLLLKIDKNFDIVADTKCMSDFKMLCHSIHAVNYTLHPRKKYYEKMTAFDLYVIVQSTEY